MAEISFSIFNSLTIRLDPTEVRGRDVAGQPVLCLPLKLQLLPAGPAEQPPGQYVLLRLAGTVSSNPIGEFGRFEAGPLAEVSNSSPFDRHHEVVVPLDRARVKRLEEARAGADASVSITFSALVWFPLPQNTLRAMNSGHPLQVAVPKSHWAERVVEQWGLDSVKLIEIRFPKSETGDGFRTAFAKVGSAERLFTDGQWKQTLAELYSAFEALAKSHGFGKPDQQFFAGLLSGLHPVKKESVKLALDGFCDVLHLGRHEPKESADTFSVSQGDARFALIMAHAIFEYITPRV